MSNEGERGEEVKVVESALPPEDVKPLVKPLPSGNGMEIPENQFFSVFKPYEVEFRRLGESFATKAEQLKEVDLGLSLYVEGKSVAYKTVADLMRRQAERQEIYPSDYMGEIADAIEQQIEMVARMATTAFRRNGNGE